VIGSLRGRERAAAAAAAEGAKEASRSFMLFWTT